MTSHFKSKLSAAIIGRFAGCALGAPVELIEQGELIEFANKINQPFPPTTYFLQAPNPDSPRYLIGKGRHFTLPEMAFLSTDDDIAYTLLALLNLEQYGTELTTKDVAASWLQYLPEECTFTAERTTLLNLKNGVPPKDAAIPNNTELEYIGAAIRIDGYGYTNPGNPQQAAALAYEDAYLSHRDAGIDSAQYFAALIALAFTSKNIDQSMEDALQYVHPQGEFYREISWALQVKDQVHNHLIANQLVRERFPDMSWVHAINNACLTVWGIHLGQNDFTTGISETVAMSYDNDCTAATVGSVLGAYLGMEAIDPKWYKPWNNRILSYLHGISEFAVNDVIDRYERLAIQFQK